MNELQRLKQLQQSIVSPTREAPQPGAMEQILVRMLGDMQLADPTIRTQEGYARAVPRVQTTWQIPENLSLSGIPWRPDLTCVLVYDHLNDRSGGTFANEASVFHRCAGIQHVIICYETWNSFNLTGSYVVTNNFTVTSGSAITAVQPATLTAAVTWMRCDGRK